MNGYVAHQDVALAAGVSQATVSRVLAGKAEGNRITPATRERVRSVARQLGYQPGRNMRFKAKAMVAGGQGTSIAAPAGGRMIGLVTALSSPAATLALVPSQEPGLAAAGFTVMLVTLPADPQLAHGRIASLIGVGVAGILCCPSVYATVAAIAAGVCPVAAISPWSATTLLKSLGVATPTPEVAQEAPVPVVAPPVANPVRVPLPPPAPESSPIPVPPPAKPAPVIAEPAPRPAVPVAVPVIVPVVGELGHSSTTQQLNNPATSAEGTPEPVVVPEVQPVAEVPVSTVVIPEQAPVVTPPVVDSPVPEPEPPPPLTTQQLNNPATSAEGTPAPVVPPVVPVVAEPVPEQEPVPSSTTQQLNNPTTDPAAAPVVVPEVASVSPETPHPDPLPQGEREAVSDPAIPAVVPEPLPVPVVVPGVVPAPVVPPAASVVAEPVSEPVIVLEVVPVVPVPEVISPVASAPVHSSTTQQLNNPTTDPAAAAAPVAVPETESTGRDS